MNKTQCTEICSSTGHRCKKMVSFAGDLKCPIHGGRTKDGQLKKQKRPCIPWSSIASYCIGFLTEKHMDCACTADQPCLNLQIVKWLGDLAKRCAGKSGYPSKTSFAKWLESKPNSISIDRLLESIEKLLPNNVEWLKRCFEDRKESVKTEPIMMLKPLEPLKPLKDNTIKRKHSFDSLEPLVKRSLIENGLQSMDTMLFV